MRKTNQQKIDGLRYLLFEKRSKILFTMSGKRRIELTAEAIEIEDELKTLGFDAAVHKSTDVRFFVSKLLYGSN